MENTIKLNMSRDRKSTVKAWLIYIVLVTLVASVSSCSTTKGYNYKKHYKKQNRKQKVVRIFDLHNCKKNNHAYKY